MRTVQRVLEQLHGIGMVFGGDQLYAIGKYSLDVIQDAAVLTYTCSESDVICTGRRVTGTLAIEQGRLGLLDGPEVLSLQREDGRQAPFRIVRELGSSGNYKIELAGQIA